MNKKFENGDEVQYSSPLGWGSTVSFNFRDAIYIGAHPQKKDYHVLLDIDGRIVISTETCPVRHRPKDVWVFVIDSPVGPTPRIFESQEAMEENIKSYPIEKILNKGRVPAL